MAATSRTTEADIPVFSMHDGPNLTQFWYDSLFLISFQPNKSRLVVLLIRHLILGWFLLTGNQAVAQVFQQPVEGPGSATYSYDSVAMYDYAAEADGFWLFEPQTETKDTQNLIVFLHGYGGYNPMIYGQWIRHLVRQGNTVIYPRYQKNIFSPPPQEFSPNVVTGILNALDTISAKKHLPVRTDGFGIVGHSYGGTLAAEITVNYEAYQLPKPQCVLLCAPGTGPFKAGRLDSYEALSEDLKLLIVVHENDVIVGDELGRIIFTTATHTPNRNLLRQVNDRDHHISAGHNEVYSVDEAFDSGHQNFTTKKALRISETNAVDYYGYWKLFDALLACTRTGRYCEVAFGNTTAQRSLGTLADGTVLLDLEVEVATEKVLSELERN